MKIDGGYILLSRKIDDSDVMKMPPATREIWLYILRKVNHSEYKHLKRGENIFHYKDIADDLCWFVGYRKVKYSKNDIAKSLRRLCEGNMIDTMKATRGVIIKVLQYDIYQDPENYEGNTKDTMKAPRRIQGESMKYKNGKNERNNISKDIGNPEQGTLIPNLLVKEKTVKEYGNSDINICIGYLKEKLGSSLDGSEKENRQYCYNLLRKLKKDYPEVKEIDSVKLLIDTAHQDKFHATQATGFKYLFYNTQKIAQSFKRDYGIGESNSDIQTI